MLSTGFNVPCPPSWGRVAPPARSWQEVAVYAVMPDGAYRYDAGAQRLVLVQAGDFRETSGAAGVLALAPALLVYVVDTEALEQPYPEEHGVLAGADPGCIVENIYRHCAGAGLAAVVRAPVDRHHLARLLGLKPSQRIVLAQAVGHAQAPGH